MFQRISEATETDLSYASIPDVTVSDATRSDASESFWMAETLKYFFLIFSEPDVVSLDDYVLLVPDNTRQLITQLTSSSNSEAHPFKIPKPL